MTLYALGDTVNVRCECVLEQNKITLRSSLVCSLETFRLVLWSRLMMVIVREHTANWWSCQTAACHGWASRWAFCPRGAWRRAEKWGWRARPLERAIAVGAVQSAGAGRGTACARTRSGPPELFPAGFPHEPGLSAHTHLNKPTNKTTPNIHYRYETRLPLTQLVKHDASNAKVMAGLNNKDEPLARVKLLKVIHFQQKVKWEVHGSCVEFSE